jgi:L-lactate dehydrogenase complex protein LldG
MEVGERIKTEIERLRKEVEASRNRYLELFIESLKRNSVEVVLSNNPSEDAEKFGDRAFVSSAASVAADTGVIFFSGSDVKRASALADHHVVIVERETLMPDIISAYKLALLKGEEIFASSSASKTADIEGRLVWGMHGPRRFTVILER